MVRQKIGEQIIIKQLNHYVIFRLSWLIEVIQIIF